MGTLEQLGTGVNNFLLCNEMTLISLAHFYAFPPDDYKQVLASRGVFLDTSAGGRPLNFGDISSIALSFGDAVKYRDIFRTAWDAGVPKRWKHLHSSGMEQDAHAQSEISTSTDGEESSTEQQQSVSSEASDGCSSTDA